ncbi:hypothetical protein GWC95_06460 [Sediminibacterium roseum]|uniref:Uncharacterized protein n=1 Tax=Sediminibacterium roseum TaxID=1978412 RepID=A0ABW9ZR24_9BACT|nr:hypothetical protein [Sediminibacterium roseum]NCI49556.1 hypothetical protein [Sediminibacterium roseum]
MKKLVVLLLNVLGTFALFGQTAGRVGNLFIGMTKARMIEAVGLPVRIVNSAKQPSQGTGEKEILTRYPIPDTTGFVYIIEKEDSRNLYRFFGRELFFELGKKGMEPVFVPWLKGDGITLKNVCLVFRNDRLIMIQPDATPEVYEKLAAAHASAEITNRVDTLACRTTPAAPRETKVGRTTIINWEDASSSARLIHRVFIDNACQTGELYSYVVLEKGIKDLILDSRQNKK